MQLLELFLIGAGLAMDAFAVSVSKGLSVHRYAVTQSLCCGLWFGGFQMLMPLAGGRALDCLSPARADWRQHDSRSRLRRGRNGQRILCTPGDAAAGRRDGD